MSKKKRLLTTKSSIRPHDWLFPSPRGTTHLPETLRTELGNPQQIPWIPDANLVVVYNPDISLEEFELGLDIMKRDIHLRQLGKTDSEISNVLGELRKLLTKREYRRLKEILEKMDETDNEVRTEHQKTSEEVAPRQG